MNENCFVITIQNFEDDPHKIRCCFNTGLMNESDLKLFIQNYKDIVLFVNRLFGNDVVISMDFNVKSGGV